MEGQGFVIVTKSHAAEIDERLEVLLELEGIDTWGSFRAGGYDFEVVQEVVEHFGFDLDELVSAIESANGVTSEGSSIEERWDRVSDLPFDGGPDGSFPSDDDPLDMRYGYGAEMDQELVLRATMLEDLPVELLDEFDLVEDTTLDGYLGFIEPEQLDAVCNRLVELGYTFDPPRNGPRLRG